MYITQPEPYFAPWLLVNIPSAKSLSNLRAADLRVLEPLTGGGGGGPDKAAPAVFRNDDVTLDLTAANVAVAAAAAGLAAAAAGLAVAAAASLFSQTETMMGKRKFFWGKEHSTYLFFPLNVNRFIPFLLTY